MIETALLCLALNVYYESRGEPDEGQMAVALVTMNRAKNQKENICGVVTKHKQFSWTIDHLKRVQGKKVGYRLRKGKHPQEMMAWDKSLMIAKAVYRGKIEDFTSGSTHYHATYVSPKWAREVTMVGQYGNHLFYKGSKS